MPDRREDSRWRLALWSGSIAGGTAAQMSLKDRYAEMVKDITGETTGLEERLRFVNDFFAPLLEVAALPGSLNRRLLIGEIPCRAINARVRRSDDGYLVLLNTGLIDFVSAIANVIAAVAPAAETAGGREIRASLSLAGAQKLFSDYARLYLSHRPVSTFHFDPGPKRRSFASALLSWTLYFVVAHELAHISCGHLDHQHPSQFRESWDCELEADAVAMRKLLEVQLQPYRVSDRFYGPIVFFYTSYALQWFATVLLGADRVDDLVSHPPPEVRCSMLLKSRAVRPEPDRLINCEFMMDLMKRITDRV